MRVPNWNIRFIEALEAAHNGQVTFGWTPPIDGATDIIDPAMHCISFASYMVNAITGTDYYEQLAAPLQYDSPLSAMKALKSLGYSSVDQLIGSIFDTCALPFVTRGDLVMLPASENEPEGLRLAVAVADPPFVWTVHPEHGVARANISQAIKAYKVT